MTTQTVHPGVLSAAERAGEDGLLLVRILHATLVVVVLGVPVVCDVHRVLVIVRDPVLLRNETCKRNTVVNDR